MLDPERYVIDQDDDGWFIGDLKNDNRVSLDLNDPVETKRTIARYAGVKGYGLGNNKSNQVTIDSSQSRNKYNY